MTFIKSELPSGYRQVERGARDTSSRRARVWSLERAAGISLSRLETWRVRQTDTEREGDVLTPATKIQWKSSLNFVCLSSGSCVKGFTIKRSLFFKLELNDLCGVVHLGNLRNLSIVCINITMLNLSTNNSLLHYFTLRNHACNMLNLFSHPLFLFSFW